MAKIRAKELTCPNCGAAVPVRNVLKAKSVVCGNCSSQLDLTKPGFEVLRKIARRPPSPDGLTLGMRGALEDGRAVEVIGRIRFEGSDYEDVWYWDEWLMLAENGEYLWLQYDEGRYELLTRFDPQTPPAMHELDAGHTINLDGTTYRVQERGEPRIIHVEGELTWRATVGDRAKFVDCRGPGGGFGAEWTAEEIEFFRRKRMSRTEVYRMLGLGALVELEAELPAIRATHAKGARSWGCSAMILAGGAFLAFLMYLAMSMLAISVGAGSRPVVQPSEISSGVDLGRVDLNAGSSYTVRVKASEIPSGLRRGRVVLRDPNAKSHELLVFTSASQKSRADGSRSFRAEQNGPHELRFQADSGGSGEVKLVKWTVHRDGPNGAGFLLFGPLLLLGSVLVFMLTASKRAKAAAAAAQEYAARRNALVTEIQQRSLIQE